MKRILLFLLTTLLSTSPLSASIIAWSAMKYMSNPDFAVAHIIPGKNSSFKSTRILKGRTSGDVVTVRATVTENDNHGAHVDVAFGVDDSKSSDFENTFGTEFFKQTVLAPWGKLQEVHASAPSGEPITFYFAVSRVETVSIEGTLRTDTTKQQRSVSADAPPFAFRWDLSDGTSAIAAVLACTDTEALVYVDMIQKNPTSPELPSWGGTSSMHYFHVPWNQEKTVEVETKKGDETTFSFTLSHKDA